MFPPNTLLQDAQVVLSGFDQDRTGGFLDSLIKVGSIGGVNSVTPESTWYAYLRDFLIKATSISNIETRLAILKHCVADDIPNAWPSLKAFLESELDEISGWNYCWQKDDPRLQSIRREGDKYYYYDERLSEAVRIQGATTTAETHLQYVTDELLRQHGRLRRVLDLFSVFATADDFSRHSGRYPLSLRLIAWTPEWGISIPARWHLSQFIKVRTIRWRPDNNLCDPEWMAAQILGEVTDSIDRDVWMEAVESYRARSDMLDDFPYQLDCVLETSLTIGGEEEALLEFEGRRFRWINGTAESKAILSVRCQSAQEVKSTTELVNRFLSALVWQSNVGIAKAFSVGGPKRLIPIASGARMHGGLRVSPDYALPQEAVSSDRKRLALALYKEGQNAASVFYRFLNYWKILELGIPKRGERDLWIATTLPSVIGGSDWLSGMKSDAVEYLRESCRNAISHVFHKPTIDPDNYDDNTRLERDVRTVEELAKALIRSGKLD